MNWVQKCHRAGAPLRRICGVASLALVAFVLQHTTAIAAAVIATIPVGDTPAGVSVSPDGGKIYVTNELSQTLSVIDSATNTVIATIPVGFFPQGVDFLPTGSKAYIANTASRETLSNSGAADGLAAEAEYLSARRAITVSVGANRGCGGVLLCCFRDQDRVRA